MASLGTVAFQEARAVVKRIIAASRRQQRVTTISHPASYICRPTSLEIGRPARHLGFERPSYDPLNDAWKEEKRMERKVGRYWGGRIRLGGSVFWDEIYSGVQLLYCSRLLDELQQEEDALVGVLGADERRDVIRLGKEAVATGQMPALGHDTKAVLERLCSSSFFTEERPFCSLLLETVRQLRKRDRKWDGLHKKLIEIYTDRPAYFWLDWCLQTRHFEGELGEAFDDEIIGVLDWKPCLEAIRSCPVLRDLMTSRPPKSILPHPYALMECSEHVLLWMAKADVPVDAGLSTAYHEIHPRPPLELVNDLSQRYKREIMPSEMLGWLRADFFRRSIGVGNEGMRRGISLMQELYVSNGADPKRLPPPDKLLMKPMKDASGPEKMTHWFPYPSSFQAFELHPDLLSRAGYEDEYGY